MTLSTEQHREIERLLYAYCDLVDRGRAAEVAGLFTPTAELDYGFGRTFAGRDALHALYRDRLGAYVATSHHTSNVVIDEIDESHIRAVSTIYAWHQRDDGSQAEVWGRYTDVIEATDAGWKIARREIRAAGWRGFAAPDGQPGPFERIEREV